MSKENLQDKLIIRVDVYVSLNNDEEITTLLKTFDLKDWNNSSSDNNNKIELIDGMGLAHFSFDQDNNEIYIAKFEDLIEKNSSMYYMEHTDTDTNKIISKSKFSSLLNAKHDFDWYRDGIHIEKEDFYTGWSPDDHMDFNQLSDEEKNMAIKKFYTEQAEQQQIKIIEPTFLNLNTEKNGLQEDVKQIMKWTSVNWGDDYKRCLADVKQNGLTLQQVDNQTVDLCMAAIKQDGWALQYVKEQTPELRMAAVRQDGRALQFIQVEERTPELCMTAVMQDGNALAYIYAESQTKEICLAAVQQNSWALRFVKNQTSELCMEAVKQKSSALQCVDVDKRTPELYMNAVKDDGWMIEYIDEDKRTNELCMAAVSQNGWVLKSIENQTDEICMAAVSQNGMALEFVYDQTSEICLTAIVQNPDAKQFVKINLGTEKYESESISMDM